MHAEGTRFPKNQQDRHISVIRKQRRPHSVPGLRVAGSPLNDGCWTQVGDNLRLIPRERRRAACSPPTFSVHHEARVASRLPSSVASESRPGRSRAAADGALPARVRRGGRSVFRCRGTVFVQSAADAPVVRPKSPTSTWRAPDAVVAPASPRTAAASARPKHRRRRMQRLLVPLLPVRPSTKVAVVPSAGGGGLAAATPPTA